MCRLTAFFGPQAPANASYMQYPREAQMMTRSTCLDKACIMGYSIVTRLGSERGGKPARWRMPQIQGRTRVFPECPCSHALLT